MDTSSGRVDNNAREYGLQEFDLSSRESMDLTPIGVRRVILRRRALVSSVVFAFLCLGVVLALRPREYIASGSLQVRSGSSNMYKLETSALAGGGLDSDDRIESEVSILQSKSLYANVAKELKLDDEKDFQFKDEDPGHSMEDPFVSAYVIKTLRKMITVERTPKTQIITIECTSISPLLASRIVNTLMNRYIERIYLTRFGSAQRAAKFLAQQLDDLKNQVLADQQKLVDLQGKLGGIGLDDKHNLVTSELEALAGANQQANIARITAEARYRILQDERPDLIDGGPALLSSSGPAGNSLLQSLRSSRAQIATQYASISEQFGPNYPESRRLKAELAESTTQVEAEEARVLEQAKIAFEAASQNQTMTTGALDRARDSALASRNEMVSYEILLHDYQSSRTLYEGLMQRLREAGVVSGLESSDIELIDLATLPTQPTGHGPMMMIMISLGLGLISALIIAFVVQSVDTSVQNVDELERFARLPVLAVLASFPGSGRKGPTERLDRKSTTPVDTLNELPIEVIRAPRSQFTEGIRLLRSSLLLARPGQQPRSMVFTSSMPGEGKSTVCSNEACMLAQNASRVLLVDADLRRPTQHKAFKLPNKIGLSNVLTGESPFEKAVQVSKETNNLHVLTSGPLPPSPGQLLGSDAMRDLLDQLYQQYDYILFDTPPTLAIADAAVLASLTDIVVLVVRSGMANKKMVLRMRNTFTRLHANIPGFVFNGVDRNSMEFYEYKQYAYPQYGQGSGNAS